MDEPIYIRSQVSYFVMKMQAPIIWQEIPLENYRITKRSCQAKVTLDFKTSG